MESSIMHSIDGEYIREWLVLGPFSPEDLDRDFLVDVGGEAHVNPKAGDTFTTADGKTLTWKPYKSRTNRINVINAIGYSDGSIAYAFCLLRSEVAGNSQIDVWGSDGGAVWINGKRVAYSPLLDYSASLRSVVNVDMEAGVNRCLVKTPRGTGPWGFIIRVLPPDRGEISGIIADEKGKPIGQARVRLEQDRRLILPARSGVYSTDASGTYCLGVYPAHGKYDLSATKGERGLWQLGIPLSAGERRTLNLTLRKAVSIEGTLLMLDDKTPHESVSVQAIRDGGIAATVLSDVNGKYRFINLKPGEYQVRCHVLGGYIYYGEKKAGEPESQKAGRSKNRTMPIGLQVEPGKTLRNINFRFAPFKKGKWKTYSTLDGLPSNGIRDICRDPEGMMWFATVGGVSRYDGKEFVNFTEKDGLASNSVSSIHLDADGVMWFGTYGGGVSRYDGREFVSFTTEDGLAHNWILGIDHDPDGVVWFGTYGGGVSRYDGREFINFAAEDGLAHNQIINIHCDPKGVVWFGTQGEGVCRYDGREFVNFTEADGLASHNVLSMHGDPDGVMWFGTAHGGVSRYDGKDFVNLTERDGLGSRGVLSIHRDPDGVMCFATYIPGTNTGTGVSCYDGKTFVNFTTKDGLAQEQVWAIYCDPDGATWFATNGAISRYDMKSLVSFTTEDGLPSNYVFSSCCTPDGIMWFATDAGVSCYDGESFVNFTTEDGLAHNWVNAIYRDPDGVMWFATDAGVSRYDGKEFVNLTARDGLLGGQIQTIHRDPDGMMWFGSRWGGISCYDGKSFRNFTTKDGLAANDVQHIYRDTGGVMWVWAFGLEGGGLSRYDGEKFIDSGIGDQLGAKRIMAIHCDPDGVIWFGTQGGGVCRYDGKEFVNLTTEDGLAHDLVRCIYRDPDGVMWFGTAAGVSRYDGSTWTSLDTRDGLAGDIVRSIHRDPDGCLWLGIGRGITRYRPTTTPPRVRITSVRNMEQRYTDLATIPSIVVGQYIAIECSAIDFKTLPEKRQYRYRIQAFGKSLSKKEMGSDWRKPVKASQFEWIPREAGTYTFDVQAIDRDLNYSEPASVQLEVIPDPRNHRIIQLEEHIRQQELAELERVHRELEDARQIQLSLLPKEPPQVEAYEIAGISHPAREVSGDFYTYLSLAKNTGIVLADVTGKSVKAAMVAAMTSGMLNEAIKMQSELWSSPGKILSELNTGLQPHLIRGMYTAMSLGILNPDKKYLTVSNAGMPYPIVKRGREIWELEVNGIPLGIMTGAEYTDLSVSLEAGDFVIFCSDGVIEAENEAGEMYQTEGLLGLVKQADSDISTQEMVDLIMSDVTEFAGDTELSDDITIVVIRHIE